MLKESPCDAGETSETPGTMGFRPRDRRFLAHLKWPNSAKRTAAPQTTGTNTNERTHSHRVIVNNPKLSVVTIHWTLLYIALLWLYWNLYYPVP